MGGLAILCLFVLGIIYLRRDARKHKAAGAPTPSGWWKGPYRTTEMQTSGLHEMENNGQLIHEADSGGNGSDRGFLSGRYSRDAHGEYKQGKPMAYELGS